MMRSSRSDCSGKRLVFGIVQIVVQPRRGGGVDGTSVLTCLDKYSVNRENCLMPTNTALTTKQARFVEEYLVDGNGAGAAVRAGYSEHTARAIACELLTKPDLQAAIAVGQATLANQSLVTRQGLIQGLLGAVEMAREQRDPMTMVRGLAEIGKMLGFYSPKEIKLAVNAGITAQESRMHRMTDQQLVDLIAEGAVA